MLTNLSNLGAHSLDLLPKVSARDQALEFCTAYEFDASDGFDVSALTFSSYSLGRLPKGFDSRHLIETKESIDRLTSRPFEQKGTTLFEVPQYMYFAAFYRFATGDVPYPQVWEQSYRSLASYLPPRKFSDDTLTMMYCASETSFWAHVTYPGTEFDYAALSVSQKLFSAFGGERIPWYLSEPSRNESGKLSVLSYLRLLDPEKYKALQYKIDWDWLMSSLPERIPENLARVQFYSKLMLADSVHVEGPGKLVTVMPSPPTPKQMHEVPEVAVY